MKGIGKGLTGAELKYIAIAAMFIDHAASLFVPSDTVWYIVLRFIGRITAPVMCFFITEGYHYTRDLRKYFGRLAVFAVISQFAYNLKNEESLFVFRQGSMIATLFLCLLAVHVINHDRLQTGLKLPLLLLIAWAAGYCDWGAEAVVYCCVFELARESRKTQIAGFCIAAAVFKLIPFLSMLAENRELAKMSAIGLGIYLPAALLLCYNGEKGGGKCTKWVFYIFYPAHLLGLGLLNILI